MTFRVIGVLGLVSALFLISGCGKKKGEFIETPDKIISIGSPEGWSEVKGTSPVILAEKGPDANAMVEVRKYPPGTYAEGRARDAIAAEFTGYGGQVGMGTSETVGTLAAESLNYTGAYQGKNVAAMIFLIGFDGATYVIIASCDAAQFMQQKPTLRKVVDSFVLKR